MPKYVNKLQDKQIVIFGGTSGIGYCIAGASLEHGARVTILSSNTTKVNLAKARLQSTYPETHDLISDQTINLEAPDIEDQLVSLLEYIKPIDHIAFTAGNFMLEVDDWMNPRADLDRIRNSSNIRVLVPFLTAKHMRPYLISNSSGCSLTLTSGATGERPMGQGMAIHTMFSARLYGLTVNLCLDVAPVRVNLVSPGAVATEMWDGNPERDAVFASLRVREIPRPEDVAEAYVYCIKDRGGDGGGYFE